MDDLIKIIDEQRTLIRHYRAVSSYTIEALTAAIADCKKPCLQCPAVAEVMQQQAKRLEIHLQAIKDDCESI